LVPTKSVSLLEFVRITDSEILSPDCITVIMNLLKMCGPQFLLCLFTFRPIALKQFNMLDYNRYSQLTRWCIGNASALSTRGPRFNSQLRQGFLLAQLSTKCSSELLWSFNVRRPSSVRPCVRPSVNNFFKQHLLWNRLLDFDQTSQEWSLGGPLSKLFKPFQLVA